MRAELRRTVLVVDDEVNLRKVLSALLRRDGYDVLTASDGEEALGLLARNSVDLVLTDLRMPHVGGMALLRRVLERHAGTPVVILTAHGSVNDAVEAMKLGAFDFLSKPIDQKELRVVVEKAVTTAQLSRREPEVALGRAPAVAGARDATAGTGDLTERSDASAEAHGLIGRSPRLLQVVRMIEKVAGAPSTVLVTGESGTGKELVAAAIHRSSPRRDRPFIRINCAAIPRDLIESELFGYERGAFTGAVAMKKGYFEAADGGTLFLDEIADTTAQTQVSFLRVLSAGEILRVGATSARKVDVRVIAASHKDLAKLVEAGAFRQDLYFRLKVVVLEIPPLRDRRDDIPLLVRHFLNRFSERENKRIGHVTPAALSALAHAPWPGNVRELQSAVESAVVMCAGDEIDLGDLSVELQGYAEVASPAPALAGLGASTPPLPVAVDARLGGDAVGAVPAGRYADDGAGPVTDAPPHALGEGPTLDVPSELLGGEELFKKPFTDAKDVAVLEFERRYVQHVLAQTGHNIAAAARLAGLDRANFRRVMNRVLQRYPDAFRGLREG
jgi:DNA-binding NtrC family response regulator